MGQNIPKAKYFITYILVAYLNAPSQYLPVDDRENYGNSQFRSEIINSKLLLENK
jgi:hypothetical protein